ncbi:MAG: type II secretion system F family protein [Planctomycetota bacterium]|jgi:type IV pilus assembly protein PilC
MAEFAYQARDRTGKLVCGVLAAASMAEASKRLANEDGLFVVDLAPAEESPKEQRRAAKARGPKGMNRRQVIDFVTQMAVMIATGVPLADAMQSISEQSRDPSVKATLEKISKVVMEGSPLSVALDQHPQTFPPVMRALIRAGEASGTMSTVLQKISSYLTKQHETTRKVRSALMMPAFMAVMCAGVTIFIMTVVLPQFTAIFADKGAALPGPTRALLAMSDVLMQQWMWLLAGLVGAVVAVLIWKRTSLGARQLAWLCLNVPIISKILNGMYLSRSLSTMGAMVDAGLPLLEATSIVRNVTTNVYYQELWENVREDIEQGGQIYESLEKSRIIPESVVTMVYSGETSGQLATVFNRVSTFIEEEMDRAIKDATQFIEPAMTVVMGGIIGFIAIAMLIPIFTVGKVMGG